MQVADYIRQVQAIHATGQAGEHSYRPVLESLFNGLDPEVRAINEPKAITVGRPDFVFQRKLVTVGHGEAKDIALDINPRSMNEFNKAQFDRYRRALPNLVYTNCLDFRFYRDGELVREISIADYALGIHPKADQFAPLAHQLKDFTAQRLQTITSAEKLAEMMAAKAVLIKDILFNALKQDKDLATELTGQLESFRKELINDLKPEDFADIYAETIAYGMFAARLKDTTVQDFSREEALQLLPRTNPFLRNLFAYVAGPMLDERIRRTIDELAEIFQATNLPAIFADFGRFTQRNDPFIHFYETFLAAYNPKKRKARGVWYTPEPVVNFMVRAVDDVLRDEFGLADGLADTSKITIDWDTGQSFKGKPVIEKKEVHRVQILDPAAGTGTFLAEVVKQIAPRVKHVAPGQWSSYVEADLLPRLHGFELLMASYAMCHMKIDMMLTELGYKPSVHPPRLGVYLTNSLEEGQKTEQILPFAQWLSLESRQANTVKRDMPIMVIIGNPPYSGHSSNKGDWIIGLMEAYKKEPGGKEKLKERNPKWINDDYVKFIRMAEHMIERNGEGVLAFITNHGYLDNPTFRGMRWHLMKTFDTIRVLDLHGNAKKKEVAPDGSADQNVFDIMQGVAIIVAVKTKAKAGADKPLAEVRHGDLWGTRREKVQALWESRLDGLARATLSMAFPLMPLTPRNSDLEEHYRNGFAIPDLLPVNSVGIVTARDALTIDMDRNELRKRVDDFRKLDPELLRSRYQLGPDVRDWSVAWAKRDVIDHVTDKSFVRMTYRPLDTRWTCYTGNSRGFQCYPRSEVMHNFRFPNLGLVIGRQGQVVGPEIWNLVYCARYVVDFNVFYRGGGVVFPLYLYPSDSDLDQTRRVNMDPAIRRQIEERAVHPVHGRPDEVAIFDYIYGVLHCPAYRQTYREFLKTDFPRIPWPATPDLFWDVAGKGGALRRLHLMEDAAIGTAPFPFVGEGDSVVTQVAFEATGESTGTGEAGTIGRVVVNDGQCFTGVPEIAWSFPIGGYLPAQKWLKDRKGRTLSFDDIRHYQKIIRILSETDRIMKTIEMPLG